MDASQAMWYRLDLPCGKIDIRITCGVGVHILGFSDAVSWEAVVLDHYAISGVPMAANLNNDPVHYEVVNTVRTAS